jgi:pyruvate dehydrogenase E1 component beta subunit
MMLVAHNVKIVNCVIENRFRLAQKGFHYLKAPIELVTPPHSPVPFSPVLEKEWLPSVERIAQAVRKTLEA